jgi:hypothetical protein
MNEIKNITGLFGLTLSEDGQLERQFLVVGDLREDPPAYVVQLFEWLMGEPSCLQVWPLEAFYAPTQLFRTEEDWKDAVEHLQRGKP